MMDKVVEQMKDYDFPFSVFFIFRMAFFYECLSMFSKSGFSCPPRVVFSGSGLFF